MSSTKAVGHLAGARERIHSKDMKTETGKVMSQCRNACRITGQGQRGRIWKSIWRKSELLQPFNKNRVEDGKKKLLFCHCLELNFQDHPGDERSVRQRKRICSTSVWHCHCKAGSSVMASML